MRNSTRRSERLIALPTFPQTGFGDLTTSAYAYLDAQAQPLSRFIWGLTPMF